MTKSKAFKRGTFITVPLADLIIHSKQTCLLKTKDQPLEVGGSINHEKLKPKMLVKRINLNKKIAIGKRIMAISEKVKARPRAHFFHATLSRSDSKGRVKEVKATEASACDTKEEILNEN